MKHKCKIFRKGKKQAGITLVALVVTVVVLLNLAGVSIRLVLDNNGIIIKAGDARDKSYIEAIKEAKEMWDTEQYLGSATEGTLAEYLYNKGVITEEEKTIVSNGETITKGKYSVSFKQTVAEAFKEGKLQVGDWVNYQNPTTVSAKVKEKDSNYSDTGYTSPASRTGITKENGYDEDIDQTYSLTNNGKAVNWRILGLSDDGRLMLTTGSPIQSTYNSSEALSNSNNPYLLLYGAESYEYGPEELNKICAIYKNDLADEAKSMTQKDIDKITGVTTESKIKEVNLDNYYGYKQYGDTYSYDNAGTPSSFLKGESATTISDKIDGYYYSVNSKVADDAPSVTVSDNIYDMLFAGTTYPTGKLYWLASRGVGGNSDYAGFGPCGVGIYDGVAFTGYIYMFCSDGGEDGNLGAVRPVVYLKSDVTVDQLQKRTDIPTSGEEAWDYSW